MGGRMEWFWPVQPDQYSIYLLGSSNSSWWDFGIAVTGALLGAGSAFLLEALRRTRHERRQQIAAGNLALLTMFRMWFEIYNYEKRIIREAVNKGDGIPLWLRISVLARTPADLRFNASDLVFMLRTADPPRLALTILQESRYHELFHAITLRNVVLTKAQEKMAGGGVGIATDPTDKELIDAIGIPDIAKLRTLTLGIIDGVYKNLVDMRTEYHALIKMLVGHFGEKNIVPFALEENFPAELEIPVENWLIRLKFENNERPSGPPFSISD